MRLPWKRREQWQERLGRNKTILWEKLREALASVVPITVIVLILSFTVAPIPTETLLAFLIGAVMVILGIVLVLGMMMNEFAVKGLRKKGA